MNILFLIFKDTHIYDIYYVVFKKRFLEIMFSIQAVPTRRIGEKSRLTGRLYPRQGDTAVAEAAVGVVVVYTVVRRHLVAIEAVDVIREGPFPSSIQVCVHRSSRCMSVCAIYLCVFISLPWLLSLLISPTSVNVSFK